MFSEIVDGTYDDSRPPKSIGDRVQIVGVTGNDFFGPTASHNNNADVDNVRSRRVTQNPPNKPGMLLGQLANVTSGKES